VEAWEGEQRICVAHFTHQSYFKDLGVVCQTAPGVASTSSVLSQETSQKLEQHGSPHTKGQNQKRKKKRKRGVTEDRDRKKKGRMED
jgi:hypothetical protein